MADYSFILPVDDGIRISSFYGIRIDPMTGVGAETHNGIDFACPQGSNVYAASSGEVIFNGFNGYNKYIDDNGDLKNGYGYGNVIILEHDDGFLTLYAHLQESNVQSGDYVFQGETIAYSGATGKRVNGAHLHFETIDGMVIVENRKIKDTIKESDGKIGKDGYNHTGIKGDVGRYNVYTGKLLNKEDSVQNRPIKYPEQCSIEPQMCKRTTNREDIKTYFYIWHTQHDNKVRSSHAHLDGTIHSIDEDIFPGEEYGCRCWAEEIVGED